MQEVIEQADELAARFEEHEPDATAIKDVHLADPCLNRADAEREGS